MTLGKDGKTALGIFQDGMTIKIAQLTILNGRVTVTELKETTLSMPFFPADKTHAKPQEPLATEAEEPEQLPDLAKLEEEIKIPDLAELEDADIEPLDETDTILTGKQEFQKLLAQFPLATSKISINALDENITFAQFDETFLKSHSHSRAKKQLSQEILTKEDIKTKNYTFDFIRNSDNSILTFVERGSNDILRVLQEINPLISKKRFFYYHVEPIEISLMNLVRNNYDFSNDQYVLIIYIGTDTKVGIIMKGNDFVKSFPIIVPETDIEHMREVVYSKIILEQDTSNINITSNIILAGDIANEADVDYFRNLINSGANISRITLDKLHIPQSKEQIFSPKRIADYCIPIALAWRSLEPRNKNFFSCNLLPVNIIESQKPFKIEWHGFIIMAAIFYIAFSSTLKNLNIQKDIVSISRENNNIELELKKNRAVVVKLKKVKDEIQSLQENLKKVDKLIGNKNQWYYILNVISNSFKENKLSWLNSFNSQESNFKISGYTTRNRNIILFSNLFPNGFIERINENTIQNVVVWQYDITYNYPDPLEIAKEKREGEPGIEFIKDNEKLIPPQIRMDDFKPQQQTDQESNQLDIQSSDATTEYQTITKLYFSKQYKQAYDKYKDFIQKYPDSDLVYNASYLMGECLYQIDDVNQAIQIFEEIVAQGGIKAPDALMMLGNTLIKKGDIEQALVYWNNILTNYPDHRLASIARAKIQYYSSTLSKNNSSMQTTEDNLEEPGMYFELQLYADTNYNAVLNEKNILASLGYTTKIVPMTIDGTSVYRLRLDSQFSHDEAVSMGKKINSQVNRYGDFWVDQVMKQNHKEDQHTTDDKEARNEYAQIVEKYFAKEYEDAYQLFSLFIKRYPHNELVQNAKYFMGEAQYQLENYTDAITIFEEILHDNSIKTPDALIMLGNAHEMLGITDKAIYYWNELINRFPQSNLADIARVKAIQVKD